MIPPTTISNAIRSSADFPGGPTFDPLCQTIANSLVAWLPTGVTLQGVTAGVIGAGTVTGTLTFAGLTPTVASILSSGGLSGQVSPRFAQALTLGLNSGLLGCTYAGVSTGVASGTDMSHVTSVNTVTLAGTLQVTHASFCAALGGSGALNPLWYTCLASAIGSIILTGVTLPASGIVLPTGPLGPGSSVGTSLSVPV